MDRTESDSPRREFSNGGLESVVTLLVRWQKIIIRVRPQEKQSSCNIYLILSLVSNYSRTDMQSNAQ